MTLVLSARVGVVAGFTTILVFLVIGLLVGRRSPGPGERDGPRVVSTTPVLFSLTAQVLGDRGSLTNLVPPGTSPETYALRPKDAEALAQADVLVMVGLGFEQFLQQALTEVRQRGVLVITASDSIPTLPQGSSRRAESEDTTATDSRAPDPHLWVDPLRAVQMVENIASGLAQADPPYAHTYAARAGVFTAALRGLDTEFRERLAAVPSRTFLASHPAWGYFADRYGLQQVAVIEEVPGREPTARELRNIVEIVRRTGVRALLTETQFSPRAAAALATDLGLQVQTVNPEGGQLTADGYERLMRANVEAFVQSLSS